MPRIAIIFTLLPFVAACGGGGAQPEVVFFAQYAPAQGVLPFPNDLLFAGSTDGTLNIPVADPDDYSDPQVGLNELDGFSTTAPITATFNAAIDPATVILGDTVRVFRLDVPGAFAELGTDDLSVGVAGDATVRIVPLRPLREKTTHLVVITRGLHDVDGHPAGAGPAYDAGLPHDAAALRESVRNQVRAQERAARADGVHGIAVSWTFTTQSIGDVLEFVHATTAAMPVATAATGLSTGDLGLGLPGFADIHAGTLDVDYYLDRNDPIQGFWQGEGGSVLTGADPAPERRSVETIPLLLMVPNASSGHVRPASGWPVVVFQHGITRSRLDLVAVADAFAAAGFASVAIDLPLHGVTDPASPFRVAGLERTFDLDVVDNATGIPGADGVIDASGTHFINLANMLNSRDNVRQAVADLFGLVAALPDLDYDGGGADVDATRVHFVGHSLGGIVGTPFLAVETGVRTGVLVAPGGGLLKLLEGSASFGPVIVAGLAAAGLVQGTPEFEAYMVAAQTMADSADPINYGAAAADMVPLYGLMMEDDLVVPNDVPGAPLSGTAPLLGDMALAPVHATTSDPGGIRGAVTFVGGDHGSLLDPTASLAVTLEIQSSIAGFLATGGTIIPIADASVVR